MRLQTIFDLLALARTQAPRSIGNAVSSYMYELGTRSNPSDYNRGLDSVTLAGIAFEMNAAAMGANDHAFEEAVNKFQSQLASARRGAAEQWGVTGGTHGW